MALTVAYPNRLSSLPMLYPQKPPPSEGFLSCPLVLNFGGSGGVTGFVVNLGQSSGFAGPQMSRVCTVFIDNSNSPGETVITPVGSGITISARPFTRGYYPVNTANLNMIITNDAPFPSQVDVVCFNYIINPVIDEQTGSFVGDGDAIVSERVGNICKIADIGVTTAFKPIAGFTFGGSDGFPFYYLTAISISYSNSVAGSPDSVVHLLDYDVDNAVVVNYFATARLTGGVIQPSTLVFNQSGMALSGSNTLCAQCFLANPNGNLNITVYGGRTSSPLTTSQFATT